MDLEDVDGFLAVRDVLRLNRLPTPHMVLPLLPLLPLLLVHSCQSVGKRSSAVVAIVSIGLFHSQYFWLL